MANQKLSALSALAVVTTDDKLYIVNDPAGTPVSYAITVGNLLYKTQTLTDGASVDWDLSLGRVATLTLGGDRTLAAPTNLIAGCQYVLIVKQDGSGGHTLAFNAAYKFPGGTDPTISSGASATDIIKFECDGTSLYGVWTGNYS